MFSYSVGKILNGFVVASGCECGGFDCILCWWLLLICPEKESLGIRDVRVVKS